MEVPQGKHAWMVKIGEKGQFVIPKEARDIFGFHPGDELLVLGDDERGIAILPKAMQLEYAAHLFRNGQRGRQQMSKIVFFCIPAYGHTNPTLGVVRELTARGHEVRYYSYEPMRTLIEAAGAQFVACDPYDCEQHLTPADGARVGKDIAFSTHILVETTLALDEMVCADMRAYAVSYTHLTLPTIA